MTKELYQNIRRSLRAFCYNLDTSITWYLDTIDETATEDTFGVVKTSTTGFEDGEFRADMINLNIFSKSQLTAELQAGKMFEGISNNYIDIKNYVQAAASAEVDLAVIGKIRIRKIDHANLGNTEGYYQINLGIHYEY
jgi:hypothetical protein